MIGTLQTLQPIAVPNTIEGNSNPAESSFAYVGVTPHPPLSVGKEEKYKKKKNSEKD